MSDDGFTRSAVYMDTTVTLEVLDGFSTEQVLPRVEEAFNWFNYIEQTCSRFDPASELSDVNARPREDVAVSPLLYELLRFALAIAVDTNGAFDPTVGHALELAGFDRNFRTGARRQSTEASSDASYRDVVLDDARRTVRLQRPLVLDLGAVAKGFAVDLAARELAPFERFAINAGGDLFVHGTGPEGGAWQVGIPHPRVPGSLIEVLHVRDAAVCTSGDYERPRPDGAGHHIVIPDGAGDGGDVASVTVVAPTAMLADALATAAFALGPERGIGYLEQQGVEGLMVRSSLEWRATAGLARYLA